MLVIVAEVEETSTVLLGNWTAIVLVSVGPVVATRPVNSGIVEKTVMVTGEPVTSIFIVVVSTGGKLVIQLDDGNSQCDRTRRDRDMRGVRIRSRHQRSRRIRKSERARVSHGQSK